MKTAPNELLAITLFLACYTNIGELAKSFRVLTRLAFMQVKKEKAENPLKSRQNKTK